MSGWSELFRGKSSIYALDEVSKEWVDRGISGQLIMFQNNQFHSDIRIKWSKNQREIWWRLMNGKLKPKGERAWVLKAWDTSNNKQEILAIRFSDVQLSTQFSIKFHQIFPPHQQQQQQHQHQPNVNVHVQQRYPPQAQAQQPPQFFNQAPNFAQGQMGMMGMNGMNNQLMMGGHGGMIGGGMMGMGGNGNMANGVNGYNGYMMNANNNQPNGGIVDKNGKTWECAVCTYSNDRSKASCIMCGLSQDSTQKANGRKITIDPSKQPIVPPSPSNHMIMGNPHGPPPQSGFFGHGPPHGGGGPNKFTFQESALKALKQQSRSQQRILSQFESHQMAASAVTSPHSRNSQNAQHPHKRRASWICPMCTLHNSTSVTRCDACNASRNIKPNSPPNPMIHGMMNNNKNPYVVENNSYNNNNPLMHNMHNGAPNNYDNKNIQRAASVQEFQQSASDIACYNDAPSQVFSTLRSVAKKLLKDDVRYRTLDTTNPKVMERLIGFEGVLDFLMLLGFESDAMGMKLICEEKPSQQVVRNAIEVLNTYESRLGLGRKKKRADGDGRDKGDEDGQSYVTLGGPGDVDPKGADEEEDTLTLEQIIIWSTHENMRDNDTMETLILTHKQFTNSLCLLKNLRRRFNVPIPLDIKNNESKISEFRLNVEKRIQLKVIKSLRDWMKTYWDDDYLNDLELQKELTSWIRDLNELASIKQSECPWIEPLASMVSKEYERFKLKSPNEQKRKENSEIYKLNPETGVPLNLEAVSIKKGYKLSNTTAEDLADAVTLMDYKIFSNIGQRECIGQAWKKKKAESPNVLAMIQQFNNLTVFVQLQILSEKSLRDRSKTIKRVIKIGERFRELKNYNSLCAILGALNSSPIHRLKAAWQRVPEKQLNQFEGFKQIFVNTRNFRNFRQLFRTTSPPAIPYFGLFLQDLVFIDDGNDSFKQIANFKQHGFMINFNKCIRTMDRIKNIRLYQTNPYQGGKHLKSQPFLQKILYREFHKMKDYTEDKIWDMSTQVKKADEGK